MERRARVTAADIARLAGVGRAAVTNWRKRHATFPTPVGGTAASPHFDLEQVEVWLADQGKLPAVADEDRIWRKLLASADDPSEALAAAGEHLHGVRPLPYSELELELADLARRREPQGAFDELWRRFVGLPGQRSITTPDALADLMVTLAHVSGSTVLDPACGNGSLLRAAIRAGATTVYGQDNDAAATRLARLWLAINNRPGTVATDDSLRRDAFPGLNVDAVVANLPFGLTNWGHEALSHDARWVYGLPPRTEPELAWVQHALAHLKPGRRAVLLMPPSAASRRAGRRIRSELLRRGAIRAVVALPPGAAAPHAISLHLWVLQRTTQAAQEVLFVDATAASIESVTRRIAESVEGADDDMTYAASVIDLLDEEVDLTPGRHGLADAAGAASAKTLHESRKRLVGMVNSLHDLLPDLPDADVAAGPLPVIGVAELVRTGSLHLLGPVRVGPSDLGQETDVPVLTSDDVVAGHSASGRSEGPLHPQIPLLPGDVVVPTIGSGIVARVITAEPAVLGRNLLLLRCTPDELDPWFLAGHLRTSTNERQTASSSGSQRYDVRKAQIPRIPIEQQRRHGAAFQKLQQFDVTVRAAAMLSGELSRHAADGLAYGFLTLGDI
ncbi:N-6 DNA methylase [Asanoa ishikariensis]|uniref:N-6 DNA methylase n=1 Tax=Asanoa ishikariensis TaxID=137265 RepID=UPI00194E4B52|nr:N-6 DNA methylase [Asanoa ishikariensis]